VCAAGGRPRILRTPDQHRQQFPGGRAAGTASTRVSTRKPLDLQGYRPRLPIMAVLLTRPPPVWGEVYGDHVDPNPTRMSPGAIRDHGALRPEACKRASITPFISGGARSAGGTPVLPWHKAVVCKPEKRITYSLVHPMTYQRIS
jgi:hypothetical protein